MSEPRQTGKTSINKINTDHTYLATVNYWTPLQIIEENEEEEEEEMNTIKISSPIEINNKSNKWTR
jgi:hypothetical protein